MQKTVLIGALLFSALAPIYCIELKYLYHTGSQYRFLSSVRQSGGYEGQKPEQTETLSRIAFKVAETKDGSGRLIGSIESSQRALDNDSAALWSESYQADFWRDSRGLYTVEPQYFAPMVRNVPYLPAENIEPGRKWIARGEDVHDLRPNLKTPFRIPFTAYYEYVGPVEKGGKTYHYIKVNYEYNATLPASFESSKTPGLPAIKEPEIAMIKGKFNQNIYWDAEMGQPALYDEVFEYRVTYTDKAAAVFHGEASSHLVEAQPMDRQQVQEELTEKIAALGLENVAVKQEEKGITLVLQDIQFEANSSRLQASEEEKLRRIGELLKQYADRDVEVEGHTAKAGTEGQMQALSEQRALSVANFLMRGGYKTQDRLIIRGKGGSQPAADNASPEGMAKNRRVEITILEN